MIMQHRACGVQAMLCIAINCLLSVDWTMLILFTQHAHEDTEGSSLCCCVLVVTVMRLETRMNSRFLQAY